MTAQGQLLVRKHQQAQIRNGGLAALLAATIGEDYLAGKLSREEFITGIVGQGRLSHDAAVRMAEQFVREYRGLEAPELVHPEPLGYMHDAGAALGRAVGVLRDLDELRANPWAPPDALTTVVQKLAVRQHQAALDAGRDVIVASAASTGRRWRRVTDGNPCAFCAMLATRSDYTSPLAAQYVVGRGKSTKIGARGRVGLGVKPRGKRQLGQRYHDRCGCTVAEVFDDWEPSYAERQQHALYDKAREACDEDGVPASPENIMRKMRELGQGVLHDAHVPDDGKHGRGAKTEAGGRGGRPTEIRGYSPRTQAGGSGGGSKPPGRVHGMLGPDTPDEFPEFNGFQIPVLRSEIDQFDLMDAEILLYGDGSGHGEHAHGINPEKSQFWPGATPEEVIDWVNAIIDHPVDGSPARGGFDLVGTHFGVRGVVKVRRYGRWMIATAHPL